MPLTEWQKSEFYKLKKAGLLQLYSDMAMNMAVPFWWSKHVEGRKPEVVQNGTLCLVNTGSRHIGVTCDHVFQGYLDDKVRYPNVECQFGNNTFAPESRLIDRSPIPALDLVTFDVPEVFASASPKNYHHNALKWPPDDVERGDVLLYGGFPQELRTNDDKVVISPFQYFITRATADTNNDRIVMEPGFGEIFWPGHEGEQINLKFAGQSGGPVYRVIDAAPDKGELLDRFELVGIIDRQMMGDLILARPVRFVKPDGSLGTSD